MTNFINEGASGGLIRIAEFCGVCGYPLKDMPCPTCLTNNREAEKKAIMEREWNIKRLGGLKAYNQFTLEKFTNKTAAELCASYPGINLFLCGAAGTGKTHLATALARRYPEAQVVKPQHIYRSCRGHKDGAEEQAAIDGFIDMPFLVIDDLGIYETSFAYSILMEIIDGRDMAEKKGLIITSNLKMGALAEHLKSEQITSRIAGMCKVIEMSGDDWRLKNA